MDVYLVTAASQESALDGTLDRFLSSTIDSHGVHILCVARGWSEETKRSVKDRYGSGALTLIEAEADLPLSRARNLALNLLARCAHGESLVAFPDDDCWYLSDTLANVNGAFTERADAAAIVGCYGPSPEAIDRRRFPILGADLRARDAVRRVSSVTMFIRTEHVMDVGGFNPELGAGTAALAGEDIDYVLRLIESGVAVVYRPEVVVGHDNTVSTTKSYAGAYVLVLAAHLRRSPGLAPLLVRGIVGSMRASRRRDGSPRFHALGYLRPSWIRAAMGRSMETRIGAGLTSPDERRVS